jgi:DNA end-binding protein Ku
MSTTATSKAATGKTHGKANGKTSGGKTSGDKTSRNKASGKGSRRGKLRASWRGPLTFGLVSIPVQAVNARDPKHSDIHFHQLHAADHKRIHYDKICPVHGHIASDEVVSGYEYRKGKYIEIEPEELDALRTKSERALQIESFVEPSEIDPILFDGRMYYLVPDGTAAEEPYTVITEAMEREQSWAIGLVVFSGKDQLVVVRPKDGILHMAMLNFPDEIRAPADVMAEQKRPRGLTRQVELAQQLIQSTFTDDFDLTAYHDHYRERLKTLIDAKIKGHEVEAPIEEAETPEVINLMDALKRSVAEAENRRPRRKKDRRHTA